MNPLRIWLFRTAGITVVVLTAGGFWFLTSGDTQTLAWALSDRSSADIYSLPGAYEDQKGRIVRLQDFRGQVSVIGFVFLNCQGTCPLIIKNMKSIRGKAGVQTSPGRVSYRLFLFDAVKPGHEEWRTFFEMHKIQEGDWEVYSTTPDTLMRFADAMSLEYSVVDDKTRAYMHTNLIAVLGMNGKVIGTNFGIKQESDLSAVIREAAAAR